jgi:predicted MFS family arabinose efflux permease
VFIATRAGFGYLTDEIGGAKVALVCVLIEAVGLGLIGLAPRPDVAFFGAMLCGLGYSLVYPGLGMEAVRRAPVESRGLAMGAYTAFLDVALGFGTPLLGLIGSGAGLSTVFLASTVAALASAVISLRLLFRPSR